MVWEDPKLLELNSEPRAWGQTCELSGSSASVCWNGPSAPSDCDDGDYYH